MKKAMSFLLALSLILTFNIPIFAAEAQSEGLKKAILTVKNAVTIPENYTEVNYSSYEIQDEAGKSFTIWNMDWSKEDGSAAISASADEQGNLFSLTSYSEEEKTGLSKVTRESAQKTADAFLEKALPKFKDSMKLTEEKQAAYGGTIPFSYHLEVNGIPAPFVDVQVGINKYTGDVQSFYFLSANSVVTALELSDFPEAAPKLSAEEAQEIYFTEMEPELKYFTYYDYKTKKLNVFAGYQMENSGEKVVDANTGELIKTGSDYVLYREEASSDAAAPKNMAAGEAALTPQEQAAVDKADGLISKDRAESIFRDAFSLGREKSNGASLSADWIEKDKYIWRLSFENVSGSVNAKTGEVISYFNGVERKEGRARISAQEAIRKADSLISKLSPEKRQLSVLINEEELNEQYKTNMELDYPIGYRVVFGRQENGITVDSNGITVGVDAQTGRIYSYQMVWYDSAEFPSLSGAMDPAAAFRKFNDKGELRLEYVKTTDHKIALAYNFKNSVSSYILDPVKGEPLDYTGELYRDSELPEYSDISGHWAESVIRKLLDNGYYLFGERFEPDKNITQEEFLRYLDRDPGTSQSDFYDNMIRRRIVTKEEKAPEAAVTRQNAAKYIVRYLGFDKLAQKSEIFQNVFKDNVAESYRGYAAICNGMGIMKGDAKGRFNGGAAMTRAEAACALYQLAELQ